MNTQLRSIIDELYALDPELRAQEKELIPILEKILKLKPDAEPDAAFVQNLRVMLRDKAASPKLQASKYSPFSILHFFTMNSFPYAVTGAVLGAVITGPVVYTLVHQGGGTGIPSDGYAPIFSYAVEETGSEAFGDLGNAQTGTAYGRGGGGMGGAPEMDTAALNTRLQSGGGGGGAVAGTGVDQRLIAPEMVNYRLKFDGEMPKLTEQQIDVLKRQKGVSGADVGTIMRSFNTGLIDLSTFRNAKADMISFYQDTDFGYIATINFRDGSISLNANWEKWPHPDMNCQDEACWQRYRLKLDDIPADDVIIGVADSFVKEHGIDLAQYGDPEVDNLWRRNYESSPDKNMFYVPDQIRVIYPLMIEGKPVYDEGGSKVGINVGINVREKKVNDIWGIMDQKYLKSSYDAVTDASLITSYLEQYGTVPAEFMPSDTAVRNVDVTLGMPDMGYMKVYTYENNVGDELIVPALIFPVTGVSGDDVFYRDTVAVPLAKDMLEKLASRPNPRPLPVDPVIMRDVAPAPAAEGE